MLAQLTIKNLAIIDTLTLDFHSGMTVLSGETGAGKSILLDALECALGATASATLIRPGTEHADISATFNIAGQDAAQEFLAHYELNDGDLCVCRRTIHTHGQSRCYVNGQPVKAQLVKQLAALLIRIHSQHAHQALLHATAQRDLLDRYGVHQTLLTTLATHYTQWHMLNEQLAALTQEQHEHLLRKELLEFQLQELTTLNLQEGEVAKIEADYAICAHAEKISTLADEVQLLLDGDSQQAVLTQLHHARQTCVQLSSYAKQVTPIAELIDSATIQLREASEQLSDFLEKIDANPAHKQTLEARLHAIDTLARKHRIPPQDLYQYTERLRHDYAQLQTLDDRLATVSANMIESATAYHATAAELSQRRAQTANRFNQEVTELMQQLGMVGGQFQVNIQKKDSATPERDGMDIVRFLVATNPGQPVLPMADIVSGGELARLSLAIESITSSITHVPVLIFDEVDTGIGGATGHIVGQCLKQLSQHYQLLCITHLAQVASKATHHIQVSKQVQQGHTYLTAVSLSTDDRVKEIARMLGGLKLTESTVKHAEEMLRDSLVTPTTTKSTKSSTKKEKIRQH
jgi:DNA repair protein RecN (Recombination protein N)